MFFVEREVYNVCFMFLMCGGDILFDCFVLVEYIIYDLWEGMWVYDCWMVNDIFEFVFIFMCV